MFCFLTSNIINGQTEEIIILETGTCDIEGTLLIPDVKGKVQVVLIIAGSGPTDRNGNSGIVGENNSLKMLAKSLAENGIASLRYDKRGVGKSSENKIEEKDRRFEHSIDDAGSWIGRLKKNKRFKEIIVIGHSEGSMIGMIISQNKHVAKYISLAGAGKSVDKLLKEQFEAQPLFIKEAANPIIDSLSAGEIVKNVPQYLNAIFRETIQPYLISWMKIDPCVELAKLNKPVLIVQGTTDIQISVKDAELLKESNQNAELVIIDGMNHIFKDVEIDRFMNIATYSKPDLPVNNILISSIVEFINK